MVACIMLTFSDVEDLLLIRDFDGLLISVLRSMDFPTLWDGRVFHRLPIARYQSAF
jgi:hypothetical protein